MHHVAPTIANIRNVLTEIFDLPDDTTTQLDACMELIGHWVLRHQGSCNY